MAVAKVKKVFIVSHQEIKDEFLKELQDKGLLEITNLREKVEGEEEIISFEISSERVKNLELLLSKINFVRSFLSRFEERKKGLLKSLIKEKFRATWEEFEKAEKKVNFNEVYEKCESIESQLTHIQNEINHLKTLRDNLSPWIGLNIKLSELKGTKKVGFILGFLPALSFPPFEKELEESFPETSLEVVKEEQNVYLILLYHKEVEEKLLSLLGKHGFHTVSLPLVEGTPKEEISKIQSEVEKLEKERSELIEEAKKLLYLKKDIVLLEEKLENQLRRAEAERNFLLTRETFMLEGWVLEEKVEDFCKLVERYADDIDLTLLDPTKEEKPPIVLKNPSFIQPFETLTRLFGMPDYNELDPTPFLAPFFFLFFGICLGDVGYGLILTLVTLWLARKLEVSENVKKGLLLFSYGGVASIIVGVLTGSYFGIDVKYLPSFLEKLMILNPSKDPTDLTTFLLLTLLLGIIQVSLGIILGAVNNIRNGQVGDAFFDQFTTLIFLWSAILVLTCFLSTVMSKSPPSWVKTISPPSSWALSFSALGIIFFHGRFIPKSFSLLRGVLDWVKKKEIWKGVLNFFAFLSSLFFALSIAGWVITFFTLSPLHAVTGKLIPFSFLLMLLLKPTRNLLAGFFSGLYSLYGMTGYIGNILSYVRLLALGLATGLIAGAFNLLVEIFLNLTGLKTALFSLKGVFLLVLFLLLVLVISLFHLVINLGMGLIGCFVHPARLQFVEFFSQFYSNGGKRFEPFGVKTKYLILEE